MKKNYQKPCLDVLQMMSKDLIVTSVTADGIGYGGVDRDGSHRVDSPRRTIWEDE